MMNIVKKWWNQLDNEQGDFEVDAKKAAQLLVSKGIALHLENGMKIIDKARGSRSPCINYDEFMVIFCRPIFKDALINVALEVDRQKFSKQLPLGTKIGSFQRNLMFNGIQKDNKNFK